MSSRRVTLREAMDLIDSPGAPAVLVLHADRENTEALRSALVGSPTKRTVLWLTMGCDERPSDLSRRIAGIFGRAVAGDPAADAAAAVDRVLDALVESTVDYSLVLEGIDAVADRRVLSIVAYLLEFLPSTLRIVLIGAPFGVGIPHLLVRARARIFELRSECT